MKTTLDAENLLYVRYQASALKTAIKGGMFKGTRPVNSKGEDVVIVSLPVNNAQLQEGVVNLNIFVPNKTINVNGVQDRSQPDHERLNELAKIACEVCEDIFLTTEDVGFDVQQQSVFDVPENSEHYVNIRIEFYAINLN